MVKGATTAALSADFTARVLLLVPAADERAALAAALQARQLELIALPALGSVPREAVGVVVIAAELLQQESGRVLKEALGATPGWSELQVVVLSGRGMGFDGLAQLRAALPLAADRIILLEKPVVDATLTSVVAGALRAGRCERASRARLSAADQRIRQLEERVARLQASEAELRLVMDSLPFLIAFVDCDLNYRFVNRAYESWFQVRPEQLVGRPVSELLDAAELAQRRNAFARAFEGQPTQLNLPWPHPDGRRRDAEIRYLPRRAPAGEVDGFYVLAMDVTERRQAEEVLQQATEALERRVAERTRLLEAEMAERQRTEAALRQAHKMEAVGQLTGGIAHDFNNMLTGVLGALDMISRNLASGRSERVSRFLEVATSSAQRAAALTHRLLAFSRQQSLDPRPLNVSQLVHSMEEFLTRTLGEQVALSVATREAIPFVHADTNQLESALLNLAINARDAMPEGGALTIATTAVVVDERRPAGVDIMEAGEYVSVTVRDTGFGMPPDVVAQAIDPFFTTKPIGQGTGLGLSMVYGFVRQSNGYLDIVSEPNRGTSITLYLPVAAAPTQALAPRATAAAPRGQGETVLVVEDDTAVRLLVLEVLRELGYRVYEAADADAALHLLRSEEPIDLLVTDVGLPGVNGRQLAEMARREQPELPVLFMTGYAEGATLRPGGLEPGMDLITKPFDLEALAQRIRLMSARNGSPAAH